MKISYTYFILGLIALLPIETNAQDQPVDNRVFVRQNKIELKGDQLCISFNIHVNQPDIRSDQGIILTPVLQSSGVIKTLPAVIINRRNRNIVYNRTVENESKTESYHKPYSVVRINKRSQVVIPYQMEIPFETWMENSDLLLREDMYCCRNIVQNVSNQIVVQNIGVSNTVPPSLTDISPTIESVKNPLDSIRFVLFFPRSIAIILPAYGQNRQDMIRVDSILTNKNLTITGIHIVGATSPDGSFQFNERLSKERALSLSSFLANHYSVSTRLEKTDGIGEDWNSLLEMVEQSGMPYKEEVIRIIKETDVFSGREAGLMKLKSGEPFRYMQEHFFPQLRRVSCTIYYETIPLEK